MAALGSQAVLVVLTSEVGEMRTTLNTAMQVVPASTLFPMIGTTELLDRIPSDYEVLAKDDWLWERQHPKLGKQTARGTRVTEGAVNPVQGIIMRAAAP